MLIVDDNPSIHDDFRKILTPHASAPDFAAPTERAGASATPPGDLADLEARIFGQTPAASSARQSVDFELFFASQGQEALQKVEEMCRRGEPPAVAFLDMRMPPGWDGLRTAQALWNVTPELHIVICTAYSDHPWQTIAAQATSSDQLVILKKPFDPIEVIQLASALTEKWEQARTSRLRTQELEEIVRQRTSELEAARARDLSRMEELEAIVQQRTAELRRMALHDKLTGLPNRVLFNERLLQSIRQARRDPRHQYAVLFIDFDRFKVINDSMGHEAGDELLQQIGERLREVLRETDTVAVGLEGERPSAGAPHPTAARLGGDEFCVLLDGIRADHDAARVAQRILECLSRPFEVKGREVHSTASIGITTSSIGYDRAEDVVRDADNAMYRAKAAGRNRFVVFDQKMHADALSRLML
ncbi:MAG: diguanylate cyclase, partial [Phycisphaerales bacterium]|nr:diguanylate cyclase [Phycisphaerales bacterium]